MIRVSIATIVEPVPSILAFHIFPAPLSLHDVVSIQKRLQLAKIPKDCSPLERPLQGECVVLQLPRPRASRQVPGEERRAK
jgi:hypothetical protein